MEAELGRGYVARAQMCFGVNGRSFQLNCSQNRQWFFRDVTLVLFPPSVGRDKYAHAGTILNLKAWSAIDFDFQAIIIREWHPGVDIVMSCACLCLIIHIYHPAPGLLLDFSFVRFCSGSQTPNLDKSGTV